MRYLFGPVRGGVHLAGDSDAGLALERWLVVVAEGVFLGDFPAAAWEVARGNEGRVSEFGDVEGLIRALEAGEA